MTQELRDAVADAISYARQNNVEIDPRLMLAAHNVGALKAAGDINQIMASYHNAISELLITYFEGSTVTAPRNAFKRAIVESLGAAFDLGWVDGGQEMPVDGDALDWFNARIESEFGFIEVLFEQAKQLRKEADFDFLPWVNARADGYSKTALSLYNAARMFASKNQMLTWELGTTEKHCDTCKSLDGKSHRATWYLARNYIPRTPGASMDCGGYNCDCRLKDKKGNEVTI